MGKEERASLEEIMIFNSKANHDYQQEMEAKLKGKVESQKLKYDLKLKDLAKQYKRKYKELYQKLEEDKRQKQVWQNTCLENQKTIAGLLEDNKGLRVKLNVEDSDDNTDQLRNEDVGIHSTQILITSIPYDSDKESADDHLKEEVFNDQYLNDMKECRNSNNSSPNTSFEEERIKELCKRNSLLPRHLRSSYSTEWLNTSEIKENDIQQGLIDNLSSAKKPLSNYDGNNNDVKPSGDTSILDHSKFF